MLSLLVQQVLKDPFFNELRTTEQLGYVVYAALTHIAGMEVGS